MDDDLSTTAKRDTGSDGLEPRLRAFLLGELTAEEDESTVEAIFVEPGLVWHLEAVDYALCNEFLNGSLSLDPARHGRLIERWSTGDGKAKLRLLALRSAAKSQTMESTARPAIRPSRLLAACLAILATLFGFYYWIGGTLKEQEASPMGTRRSNPGVFTRANGRQYLEPRLTGMIVEIDPQKALYWRGSGGELTSDYELILRLARPAPTLSITRHLILDSTGDFVIPFQPDELPFSITIRDKRAGGFPIQDVVLNASKAPR